MTSNLDLNKSDQYKLSIRLSTDGFSFAVCNYQTGNVIFSRNWAVNSRRSLAANVKSFLAENQELAGKFKHTSVLIDTLRYTTLPLEHYEDEQTEMLFYQNLPKKDNENILCNILGESNLVILFSIDKLTHQFIIDNFPEARIFVAVSPQVEELAGRCKQEQSNILFANLHPETTDVLCFRQGKLQTVNSYKTSTAEDRCYYIAGLWNILSYDSMADELHIVGETKLVDSVSDILKDMVKNISKTVVTEDGLAFDLQALLNCERQA